MDALQWVQDSGFGTWIRESSWALFAALIVHTAGMGFLAGTGIAINLRVLGVASSVPLTLLPRLFPVMWAGFALALFSGVVLVIGYPAKALTNPLFYIKLVVAVIAALLLRELARKIFRSSAPAPGWAKAVAAGGLVCWASVIVAGRFLAYTHRILLVY